MANRLHELRRAELKPQREPLWQPGWLQTAEDGPIEVSICIVNWNCRELLRKCLQSVLEYPQGVRLEVIVVDNASTDDACDLITGEFPEVTLIRNRENRGFSAANNQAVAHAQGKYLFFLNNDTVVPAGSLRRLYDLAEREPHIAMIGPKLSDPSGQTQISYRRAPTLTALLHRTLLFRGLGLLRGSYRDYRRHDFDASHRRNAEALMGAAIFVRADAFRRAGQWDESFPFGAEDIDLSLRVGQFGDIVFYPGVEIVHHGRVSSRQNIAYATSNLANGYVRLLRKAGTPAWKVMLYKLAVTIDAPLQLGTKCAQYLYRRVCGKPSAAKTALSVRGVWSFLTRGLPAYWRM